MELSEALAAGLPVLLPTDTVYGLAAGAEREEYTTRLYAVKGREPTQPTALLAANIEALLEAVPELNETLLRTLLPGPLTLVLPNPSRRYPWLTGDTPEAIGVRVPALPEEARQALGDRCVAATSANDPGGPDPTSIDDVPARIRAAVAAELDVGPLPGTPSTVIDFTGPEPRVLREGAAPGDEAIARVRASLPT
jgi:L-threonylcarbamoyladenylate synthase